MKWDTVFGEFKQIEQIDGVTDVIYFLINVLKKIFFFKTMLCSRHLVLQTEILSKKEFIDMTIQKKM